MIDPSTIATLRTSDTNTYTAWQSAGRKTLMRLDPHGRTAGPLPYVGSPIHQNSLTARHAYTAQDSAALKEDRPDIVLEKDADDDFSFGDIVDMVNPLQHLPVIGMIYRNITGDVIKPISNIIGGTLFGGPIGAVSSTINVIVKDRTGRDIGENALAAFGFDTPYTQPKKPEFVYEAASNKYKSAQRNFVTKNAPDIRWNA